MINLRGAKRVRVWLFILVVLITMAVMGVQTAFAGFCWAG
jgi:hypothetical protein